MFVISELLGCEIKKLIIEVDNMLEAAIISVQYMFRCKVFSHLMTRSMGDQGQIPSTPSVNRLLGIPNDEISIPLTYGVGQERKEISPLECRGVLKLIDQIIMKAATDFFVDKVGITF